MKTFTLTAFSFPLIQILSGVARAEGNRTLPIATFNESSYTWFVTVPETWDFSTILNATNRAHAIDDPYTALSNFPFPHTEPPGVYVNGSLSIYATNALNYGMLRELNASITPYSDENWMLPVVCEWPISGMYNRLNRILYYLLLVFALVVHHHEWLVAGALASATTYSGAAAIQAWVQFGVINSSKPVDGAGDNDNEAIMGILAAGLLMAVPLINWSRTLRRLQARPILIYWAIITLVGYVLVIVGAKQTAYSNGWNRHAGGLMTCTTTEQLPAFKDLGFITHDFITKYNCDDPCYNPKTMHPFHSKSSVITRVECDLVTWTAPIVSSASSIFASCFGQCPREIADTCWLAHDGWTVRDFRLIDVGYYGFLPVALFELFFVLCFGRLSPEEIRDRMFIFFVGKKLMGKYRQMPSEKRKGKPTRTLRMRLAQLGALVFYFLAALTYLVCIPFFIASIAWQERLLRLFPDAEDMTEVSQWLPYVVVILTLGAAIVGKYHHVWHVYIGHYLLGHEKRHAAPVTKAVNKKSDLAGWLQRSTWRTRSRLSLEWRDFLEFCVNPFFLVLDGGRERTSDIPTVKYSFIGNLPFPEDHERNSKKNYRGPWVKDDDTWRDFGVEFCVEADNRTLKSWERYQHNIGPSTLGSTGEHIVYNVQLPPIPSYPDQRTVVAKSKSPEIIEKISPDPNAGNNGARMTQAMLPGPRRKSTVSFGLHTLPDPAPSVTASRTPSPSGSSRKPGSSNGSSTQKPGFVIQTAIPPSTMSSIQGPTTPTAMVSPVTDPTVPPVPVLQSPALEVDQIQGTAVAEPPSPVSPLLEPRHSTDTTAQPPAERKQSIDSAPPV